MVRECSAEGCHVLTMGELCLDHEREHVSLVEALHDMAAELATTPQPASRRSGCRRGVRIGLRTFTRRSDADGYATPGSESRRPLMRRMHSVSYPSA